MLQQQRHVLLLLLLQQVLLLELVVDLQLLHQGAQQRRGAGRAGHTLGAGGPRQQRSTEGR